MKLGVAYNIFNGEELLIKSLERMREHADFIVLTVQFVSNVGNENPNLFEVLDSIPDELYDDSYEFNPKFNIHPQQNELNKRNKGLEICRINNCTHFMSIDCDEFYNMSQFSHAKKFIEAADIDGSFCELRNYFKESKYQMDEQVTYVPFIYKISQFSRHVMGTNTPVPIDPTRGIQGIDNRGLSKTFRPDELVMHHMSYVRSSEDMLSKLTNSPNKQMFEEVIKPYMEYFNNWKYGQAALNPHQFKASHSTTNNVRVVTDILK